MKSERKNESEQDRDEQAEIGNRSTQTIYLFYHTNC